MRGVDSLLPAFLCQEVGKGKGEGGERWGREVEEEGGGEARGHGRGEVGEASRAEVTHTPLVFPLTGSQPTLLRTR